MPKCPDCENELKDTIDVICLECGYIFSRSIVEIINKVEFLESVMKGFLNTYNKYYNNDLTLEDHRKHIQALIKQLEGK